MSRIVTRTVLAGSGSLLGLIGGGLMFAPKTFLETSHVFIDHDPGLISELTAPSGLLILTGAVMLLGAGKFRFAGRALTLGAIVYGSYGLGRLVSMGLHGVPSESLIAATVIELSVAAVLVALRWRPSPATRWKMASSYSGERVT